MSGLTSQGFELKRLEDIQSEIETVLRSTLGNGINLLPTELLGQIVGILSEREALLHELAQDVYNSQYPTTANGISLDNVAAITAIKRLPGTPSTVSGIAYGTRGTVIPLGSKVSVAGRPSSVFKTINAYTIGSGMDEVQKISFNAVPDAGEFTLVFKEEEVAPILFNATAADVQKILNDLISLSDVEVTGDFALGFTVKFTKSDGEKPQPLISVGTNKLTKAAAPVVISISEIIPGILPNVTMDLIADQVGPIEAHAGTLTVIETVIAGWDSFTNPKDALLGRNVETDAELRIRRRLALANPGAATVEAIRGRLLQLEDVRACVVYENITMVKDLFGRPPKSVEAIVLGGKDPKLAETLWLVAPAGIELVGTTVMTVIDSQGFKQIVKFSRPVVVEIWLEVDVVTDFTFPTNGDKAIVESVLNYARKNLSIGDDVITIRLVCPIIDVQGVTDVKLRIGTKPNPLTDANIPIAPNEIALFDSARIKVKVA